jgi:hypothetical protein
MMLCHELAIPSRRHLRALLTEQEIIEWMIFNKINPIGGVRGDINSARVAFTIAQVNSTKPKDLNFRDFLPDWKDDCRKQNSAVIQAGFIQSAMNKGRAQ